MKTFLLAGLLMLSAAAPAAAQDDAPPVLYLILDGSGSMWGQLADGTHKVTAAKEVLDDFVSGDLEGYDLALRAYGHRRKGDCRDSELVVPFGPPEEAIAHVRAFAQDLNPLGKTPISYSLRQALDDFGDRSGQIILISDGIETCDEDPCALVQAWQSRDVAIKVHVVGLGLDDETRPAMQCIADAAGTTYRDAADAATLAASLEDIQEESASGEPPAPRTDAVLYLRGVDADGNPVRVEGVLVREGEERYEVSSNRRNVVESGPYQLRAGVPTKNGTLYAPVEQAVEVAEVGVTPVTVEMMLPPRVHAIFLEDGERQPGSLVRAYADGREAFSLRPRDTVFVQPGTYEFRAQPNRDNELAVTETVEPGEHQEVVFELVQTVKVYIEMTASETGQSFGGNFELWQDGAEVYRVHQTNGARVQPGTYELRKPDRVAPYIHGEPLVITRQEEQTHAFVLPVGHVTFKYAHADGTPDDDARVFLSRLGPPPVGQQGVYQRGGVALPLLPGRYSVAGWRQKGTYDPVEFEVAAGQELTVTLRAQ